jgi:lysine 2,3-aminomutase
MTEPKTLRTAAALVEAGLAAPDQLAALNAVAARYAIAIPPQVRALIDADDPSDPIARQFVPSPDELIHTAEERADPVGDDAHSPVQGVVHRYPDRALLMLTHTCAAYCRFCFRRERVGGANASLPPKALQAALAYIDRREEIWEVILTGGDPLVLSPRRLSQVMGALAQIDHVKVVRIHTKVPAVAPERVTAALIEALRCAGKAVYVALHVNHPREMTPQVRSACARLVDAGLPMVSQTVLLRGVNDDATTLAALMRAFVETRIKPYYLHHGDYALGTGHLRAGVRESQALARGLRGRYSGLCQPTLILDIPGGHGKAPIGPTYLCETLDGYSIEDPWGERHAYPPKPED